MNRDAVITHLGKGELCQLVRGRRPLTVRVGILWTAQRLLELIPGCLHLSLGQGCDLLGNEWAEIRLLEIDAGLDLVIGCRSGRHSTGGARRSVRGAFIAAARGPAGR